MRIIFGLVFVLGISLAGFAVYLVQGHISQTEAQLEAERRARVAMGPMSDVLIIKRDLKYGDTLKQDDVARMPWPQSMLPPNAFTDVTALFPENDQRPRTVLRPMDRFEPILASKVTEPGEEAGLNMRLPRGMRAFAIRVDVASGVSGFLRPGDRVDVYWSGGLRDGAGEITRLIEAGVRIVAIDQMADDIATAGAQIARTVTVEVSPQQVAALAQAQSTGRLSLALVGQGDDSTSDVVQIDQQRLLGIEAREVVTVEQEQVCTIRTRRGGELDELVIPCTN
jgi:pilus assembly protein CpaB